MLNTDNKKLVDIFNEHFKQPKKSIADHIFDNTIRITFLLISLNIMQFIVRYTIATSNDIVLIHSIPAQRACNHYYPKSYPISNYFGAESTCWIGNETDAKKVGEVHYTVTKDDIKIIKEQEKRITTTHLLPYPLSLFELTSDKSALFKDNQ